MWDLSSQTSDRTRTPCIGRQSLNHWTTRGVPLFAFEMTSSFAPHHHVPITLVHVLMTYLSESTYLHFSLYSLSTVPHTLFLFIYFYLIKNLQERPVTSGIRHSHHCSIQRYLPSGHKIIFQISITALFCIYPISN